ncbi:TcdA/TcdB pore-forming domain-containing protein [Mitsuaria sp. 7]|uniref:TcdA/TcdB pore-forming domain-containing protein n=1 Tax=Mitsuaria sp. 7 TaxID=1658665 RepID=UPI0007DD4F4C|nr:TcdA/TcdB pore-forming domain-containing protein [Mitsuaria sp. 7]ANH70995.1 hypothetical protein ABE85_26080 [Mitsuaria sp. 7]
MPAFNPALADNLTRLEPVERSRTDSALASHAGVLMLFARELAPRAGVSAPGEVRFADGTKDALTAWAVDFVMRAVPPKVVIPPARLRGMWTSMLSPLIASIMTAVRTADFSGLPDAAHALSSNLRLGQEPEDPVHLCRYRSDNTLALAPVKATEVVLPLSEGLMLKLLGLAVASARSASPDDATAGVKARVQALKALLCEQPLKVDLAHARTLWRAEAPQQPAAFEAIRDVVAAQDGLARRGLVPATRFIPPGPSRPRQRTPEDRVLIGALLSGGTDRPAGPEAATPPPSWSVLSMLDIAPTPSERAQGAWVFQPDRRGSRATLHVDPLPADASMEDIARQDRQFRLLRDFVMVRLFQEGVTNRLQVTLKGDDILVGDLPVASRSRRGVWLPDVEALKEARSVTTVIERPGVHSTVDQWWDGGGYRFFEPRIRATEVRQLRLFLQMGPDSPNLALERFRYPDEAVWIQIDRHGHQRIVGGGALLSRITPDTRVKLEIEGHDSLSDTGTTELEHYAPAALVDRVKSALHELGITRTTSRVTLRSCALVSRAVPDSFAERFIEAGVDRGLLTGDAQVTAYSEIMGFDLRRLDWFMAPLRRPDTVRVTLRYLGAAEERHAPGKTWIYRRDPATGLITRHDKYPAAPGQRPADTVYRESSSLGSDYCVILGAAGRIIDRVRPSARHHLLPVPSNTDPATLRFLDETTGTVVVAALDDAGEAGLVDLYLRQLSAMLETQAPDGLNAGLLALALSQLSRTSATGSPYQAAVAYLGMTQGAAFLGADAVTLANSIRATMQSTDAAVVSGLARTAGLLAEGLRGLGSLLQVGVVGLDIKSLVDAIASGRSSAIGVAGTQLAFDIAGLGLLGASAIAALAGFTTLAAGLRELAVPLAGIAIGVTGLALAVAQEQERLVYNLQPLGKIDEGYDTPLRLLPPGTGADTGARASSGGSDGDRQFLAVAGWAPVNRIDFVNGEVGFGDATIGETSLRLSGLYTSAGHPHEWKINDGSDAQTAKSREGMDLDLWSLLWKQGRAIRPVTALTQAHLDPSHLLILATSATVDIDSETFSNSRAGGDFSLLGDARLDRMERRSGGQFVGDYVSSGSMAKSADVWRYRYRNGTLSVVLDQQPRVLVLPGRAGLDDARFTFRNHDGEPDREIRPLDQSSTDYRLIGGGGQVVLLLPGDGTVRNPVTIVPSARSGESWTIMLDGALTAGGKAFEFLHDEGKDSGHGESATLGFRLNGQTIRFEAMPDGPVRVVDPGQPELSVSLDLRRRHATLVVDLGYEPYDVDPLAEVHAHLDALGKDLMKGGLTALVLPEDDESQVLLTAQVDATDATPRDGRTSAAPDLRRQLASTDIGPRIPLVGYLDLQSGHAVLQGGRTLWIHDPVSIPTNASTRAGSDPAGQWIRKTTIDEISDSDVEVGVDRSSTADARRRHASDRGAPLRAERKTLLAAVEGFATQLTTSDRPWMNLGDTPALSRDFALRLRHAGVDIVIDVGDDPRGVDRDSVDDHYDADAGRLALFKEDLGRLIEIDDYLAPKSRRRDPPTLPFQSRASEMGAFIAGMPPEFPEGSGLTRLTQSPRASPAVLLAPHGS